MKIRKFNESKYNDYDFVWVSMDDWCGFYYSGQLLYQGHDMNTRSFLQSCKQNSVSFSIETKISQLDLEPTENQVDRYLQNLPKTFDQLMMIIEENGVEYHFNNI